MTADGNVARKEQYEGCVGARQYAEVEGIRYEALH